MKKRLLKAALLPLAFPLLVLGCSTYAFAGDDVSVSVSVDYVTEYVFRGTTLAGDAFQPGAEISVGQFTAGIWASTPSGRESIAFADEIDLYASYSLALSDKVSADIGATLYHYPQAGGVFDIGASKASTFEPYVSLGFDAPLSPSLSAYYDVNLNAFTLEGGAGYSFPVAEKTSFDVSGSAGLVSVKGGGDYQYGSLSGALSYAFTETTSVYAGVNAGFSSENTFADASFDPLDPSSIAAPDKSSLWFGLGISSGF